MLEASTPKAKSWGSMAPSTVPSVPQGYTWASWKILKVRWIINSSKTWLKLSISVYLTILLTKFQNLNLIWLLGLKIREVPEVWDLWTWSHKRRLAWFPTLKYRICQKRDVKTGMKEFKIYWKDQNINNITRWMESAVNKRSWWAHLWLCKLLFI